MYCYDSCPAHVFSGKEMPEEFALCYLLSLACICVRSGRALSNGNITRDMYVNVKFSSSHIKKSKRKQVRLFS